MNLQELRYKLDNSNMFAILLNFAEQISDALEIANKNPIPKNNLNKFVILGMGGSAISGDLISDYLNSKPATKNIQIIVNRDYELSAYSAYIDSNTIVIASSYSGNTEETINALYEAEKFTRNIICISSGGKLSEIAKTKQIPLIKIPSGMMPRCAVAYSFFPILLTIAHLSGVSDLTQHEINTDINGVINTIKNKSTLYSTTDDNNPAIQIAGKLSGTIPVIYSSNALKSINLRWRCQIQENSKNLCFGNLLPEMNHNEINSWIHPSELLKNFSIVLIKEQNDINPISNRFNAVNTLLESEVNTIIPVISHEQQLLSRMFDLLYLGDWVSYWLALLNNEDPTPIPIITKLKRLLS